MNAVPGIYRFLGLPQHIRGIVFKEWLAHRNIVVGFWVAWLVIVPILMIFPNPRGIFALGLLYSILAAPRFGGMDAAEGSEEFVFSLPATRKEIFLTRLALGGGNLLAMLVLSLLCLLFNLPQKIWGVFVESAFTQRFPPSDPEWYGLAFCLPLSIFAISYVLASLARTRGAVDLSWSIGLLIVGAVLGLTWLAEMRLYRFASGKHDAAAAVAAAQNIIYPITIVSAVSVCILVTGCYRYLRKEGINRPAPFSSGIPWWAWVLILLGILFIYASLNFFGTSSYDVPL
jgi:hypothetical protein